MVQTTTLNKVNCKFCGKELEQKELLFELNNRQFSIEGQAERCDCEESKMYWEKIDYEKKQKEIKEEIQRKNDVINKLYTNSKMNIRLKSYSFNNYKVTFENKKALNKAKEYAENYIKKVEKGSLFITGGVGTGKTHLAASIANELTFWGSFYLAIIATLAWILVTAFGIPFYFGGTTVLIVVQVAIDTMRKIEAQIYMNKYKTLSAVGL